VEICLGLPLYMQVGKCSFESPRPARVFRRNLIVAFCAAPTMQMQMFKISSSNSIHRNRATADANFCFEIHFHGRADAIFPCVICRALFSFRIHLRAGEIIFSLEMLKTLVLPSETLHQCVCVAFPFTVMLTFASLSRLAAAAALMFEVFSPSAAVKDSCQKSLPPLGGKWIPFKRTTSYSGQTFNNATGRSQMGNLLSIDERFSADVASPHSAVTQLMSICVAIKLAASN
jgi:hypothetical protein